MNRPLGDIAEPIARIAVDWGTSNLRVWALSETGQVLGRGQSDQGMGQLERDGFQPALMALIEPVLSADRVMPVICCGMVGAKQGWAEATYRAVPCTPPGIEAALRVPETDPRIAVYILPGVSQDKPADVMRGEETQVAGLLHALGEFDGVICMPGTHTKWVHVSAGEIVSFQTFMTGELFALLSNASVLRHSVSDGWDQPAFAEAVADAMARPEKVAGYLFRIRAEGLLHATPEGVSRARLSGLLIGAEIAAARPYWLGQPIALLGEGGMVDGYGAALKAQSVDLRRVPGEDITLAGLNAAAQGRLREGTGT